MVMDPMVMDPKVMGGKAGRGRCIGTRRIPRKPIIRITPLIRARSGGEAPDARSQKRCFANSAEGFPR